MKNRKALLDLKFLNTCKDFIPEFLNFKVANYNLRSSANYKRCQEKLLLEEILNKRNPIKNSEKHPHDRYDSIKPSISIIDIQHVIHLSLSCNEKHLQKCKFIHLQTLRKLIRGFTWDLAESSFHDSSKVISNFSSYNLTTTEKLFLSKGLFNLPELSYKRLTKVIRLC